MGKVLLFAVLLGWPLLASSSVPLFHHTGETRQPPAHPAVLADHVILPNIRELAGNAARADPEPIVIDRPGRPALTLRQARVTCDPVF